MRFSCQSIIFRGTPLTETIKQIASIGFEGIETSVANGIETYGGIENFAEALREHGLHLSGTYLGAAWWDRD